MKPLSYLSALLVLSIAISSIPFSTYSQNTDPNKIQLITSDLDNFWIAYDLSLPDYNPDAFKKEYIKKGSKGLKGFMNGRIKNADNLVSIIKRCPKYHASLR